MCVIQISQLNRGFLLFVLYCWYLIALMPDTVSANSGIVSGKVVDIDTERPLPGAVIKLDQIGLATVADKDGRFVIRHVPAGSYRIFADYPGYFISESTVTAEDGVRVNMDFTLKSRVARGDYVLVRGLLSGRARAQARQQNTETLVAVLSNEQMKFFSDYSIRDAVIRVPGVQANRNGNINLRGVGFNRFNVVIDGQRLATTGLGSREVDLGLFSIGLWSDLEVVKIVTPDMDAEALGGTVHIRTLRPSGGDMHLDAYLGGGAVPDYFLYTGIGGQGSVRFAATPRDDFSIAANMNYQMIHKPSESLFITYDNADFGSGPVDVVEALSPRLNIMEKESVSGNLQLTYHPSDQTTFFFRGIVIDQVQDISHHTIRHRAGNDWASQDSTGLAGRRGSYADDTFIQGSTIRQYHFQAGAGHLFDRLNLDYRLGWSRSIHEQVQFTFSFLPVQGMDYLVDMNDRRRPVMQVNNFPLMMDGTIDRQLLRLQEIPHIIDEHTDHTFSAGADLEYPLRRVTLKAGTHALRRDKTGNFSHNNLRYLGALTMFRFNMIQDGKFAILDTYNKPWLLNPHNARFFIESNMPVVVKDDQFFYRNSEIWNYHSLEGIYAGYGMATVKIGNITATGGARAEYTDAKYQGRNMLFSEFDRFVSSLDTTVQHNYLKWFPHAQVNASLPGRFQIQVAYSRTMARAPFNMLSPFEFSNLRDSTVFRGNPKLEPVMSDNLDANISRFNRSVGLISFGLFYKQLSGFITDREQTLDSGNYQGFKERTFVNSGSEAIIYGFDIAWQQDFAFLPGFLGNFGTHATYSWAKSEYSLNAHSDRDDDLRLPGQSPHVVNTAIYFNRGRFSTQIAYHWTASSLLYYAETPVLAPSIDKENPVYLDRHEDGARDISLAFRFRISDNFRLWIDAKNLFPVERDMYDHTRAYYPREISFTSGAVFRAGVHFVL